MKWNEVVQQYIIDKRHLTLTFIHETGEKVFTLILRLHHITYYTNYCLLGEFHDPRKNFPES